MPPTVTIVRAFRSLIVGVSLSLALAACSSSSGQRDINYGTDVAVGFVPPDGAAPTSIDATLDAIQGETAAAMDTPQSSDGGAAPDGSSSEGN